MIIMAHINLKKFVVLGALVMSELFNEDNFGYSHTHFTQEVDGESLFTLDPEMMVKLMNLKTGPALKIHRKVAALKKQYGTLPSFV